MCLGVHPSSRPSSGGTEMYRITHCHHRLAEPKIDAARTHTRTHARKQALTPQKQAVTGETRTLPNKCYLKYRPQTHTQHRQNICIYIFTQTDKQEQTHTNTHTQTSKAAVLHHITHSCQSSDAWSFLNTERGMKGERMKRKNNAGQGGKRE